MSPLTECTEKGLSRADSECNRKTTILQDRMIGHDRRLLFVRYFVIPGHPPLDDILIYGCIAGQVKNYWILIHTPRKISK